MCTQIITLLIQCFLVSHRCTSVVLFIYVGLFLLSVQGSVVTQSSHARTHVRMHTHTHTYTYTHTHGDVRTHSNASVYANISRRDSYRNVLVQVFAIIVNCIRHTRRPRRLYYTSVLFVTLLCLHIALCGDIKRFLTRNIERKRERKREIARTENALAI